MDRDESGVRGNHRLLSRGEEKSSAQDQGGTRVELTITEVYDDTPKGLTTGFRLRLTCRVAGSPPFELDFPVRVSKEALQQARFPILKTLEQFDFTWPGKLHRAQVQDLFRFRFVEDKANVIFVGGVGLGKSHLSIALGCAACLAGHSVLFATAIDIINTLSAAQNAGRPAIELKKYLRPAVLVMDELGYLPIDKRGADLLFQIISRRYGSGPAATPTRSWPAASARCRKRRG